MLGGKSHLTLEHARLGAQNGERAERYDKRKPPAMRLLSRCPPNFCAIAFGLAGLALVWRLMASFYGSPAGISDVLFVAAAVVWLGLAGGCVARLVRTPRVVLSELRNPVLAPFWALVWIVGMLLAVGLQPHAPSVAKVVFVVFLVATIVFGGWLTGQWIAVPLDPVKLHPGYFLPTVAGGLVGAECAAGFGLRGVGWLSFGIGIVCWMVLGSLIINRLFFLDMLPAALVPTLAIELAPPVVGGSAYFELHGPAPDALAYGLAGYAVLMVLVQIRLLPLCWRLTFSPGFWSFTFPWCAVIALALRWLQTERPAGQTVYSALAAGAVSVLVAAIAVRSVGAIVRGDFVPRPVVALVAPVPVSPSAAQATAAGVVAEATR